MKKHVLWDVIVRDALDPADAVIARSFSVDEPGFSRDDLLDFVELLEQLNLNVYLECQSWCSSDETDSCSTTCNKKSDEEFICHAT